MVWSYYSAKWRNIAKQVLFPDWIKQFQTKRNHLCIHCTHANLLTWWSSASVSRYRRERFLPSRETFFSVSCRVFHENPNRISLVSLVSYASGVVCSFFFPPTSERWFRFSLWFVSSQVSSSGHPVQSCIVVALCTCDRRLWDGYFLRKKFVVVNGRAVFRSYMTSRKKKIKNKETRERKRPKKKVTEKCNKERTARDRESERTQMRSIERQRTRLSRTHDWNLMQFVLAHSSRGLLWREPPAERKLIVQIISLLFCAAVQRRQRHRTRT